MASASHLLHVFIAGNSARSVSATETIERLCEKHMPGDYELEIFDVLERPEDAAAAAILATPTVVRRHPPPELRLVGDLSDEQAVLAALRLGPHAAPEAGNGD
ncbi:MAG TPA: circadian clock KaiB family protein [Solirubrobacterales bacterium]|nr:circadian clock KaiB family protein [Solirubrobacterales bacterium]